MVTVQRGVDPTALTLVPFGGAGPLHAGELARELGIRRLAVPPGPGTAVRARSARGGPSHRCRADAPGAARGGWPRRPRRGLRARWRRRCCAGSTASACRSDGERIERWLDLRYVGQNFELLVRRARRDLARRRLRRAPPALPRDARGGLWLRGGDEPIQVVNVRLVARGLADPPRLARLPPQRRGIRAWPRSASATSGSTTIGASWRARCTRGRGSSPVIASWAPPWSSSSTPPRCCSRTRKRSSTTSASSSSRRRGARDDGSIDARGRRVRAAHHRRGDGHRAHQVVVLDEHQGAAGLLDRHLRRAWGGDRSGRAHPDAPGLAPRRRAASSWPAIRRRRWRPGDIFISNDPYTGGGTHLPDINLVSPVFADGALFGFVANIAHHADRSADRIRTIWDEGLRITPIRLAEAGRIREDVMELLLANFALPEQRRGDFRAQIAANRLGERRLGELIGAPRRRDGARRLRGVAGLRRAQDPRGHRRASGRRLPLRGRDGRRRRHDHTHPHRRHHHQAGRHARARLLRERAAVRGRYQRRVLRAPGHGVLRDPGGARSHGPRQQRLLSRPRPSPLPRAASSTRSRPRPWPGGRRRASASPTWCCGALAGVVPERVPAAGNGANCAMVFSGVDPRTGALYVYLETLAGGAGGTATGDGMDAVQVHVTNTSNLPVESLEIRVPAPRGGVRAGGRQRRGGPTPRWARPPAHDRGPRPRGALPRHDGAGRVAPWGLLGGRPGGRARLVLDPGGSQERELPPKVWGHLLRPGDRVAIETPGAGGYGPPEERDPARRHADERNGVVARRGPGRACASP